jgi:multiple sugar transport system substrate-binding protein
VEDEVTITRLLCSVSAAAALAVSVAHADGIDWKKELGNHEGKTLRIMTITDPFVDSIKKTKDGFTKLTGANVEVDGYGYDALHEKELQLLAE